MSPKKQPQALAELHDDVLLRERQIIGSKTERGLLPISSSTLWRWINEGKFPRPRKLGEKTTVWRAGDVRAWIAAQPQA